MTLGPPLNTDCVIEDTGLFSLISGVVRLASAIMDEPTTPESAI